METQDDREEAFREDPRSTSELIELATANNIDQDGDEFWNAVWSLQYRLPRILSEVKTLSESIDPKMRTVAADVLGQGRIKEKVLIAECVELLAKMARLEARPDVLESITFALGHYENPQAVELLLAFSEHQEEPVRLAATHGLCGRSDPASVRALIKLSIDSSRDVRSWATFALASQIDTDTPEIRDALAARLQEHNEVRGEAYVGLAERGDTRMIAPFLHDLNSMSPEELYGSYLITDAACAMFRNAAENGNAQWIPVLEKLDSLEIGKESERQKALERCRQRNASD